MEATLKAGTKYRTDPDGDAYFTLKIDIVVEMVYLSDTTDADDVNCYDLADGTAIYVRNADEILG